MNTIVVLGGNELAIPGIAELVKNNYKVICVDGNVDAPAKAVASEFVHCNFLNLDDAKKALAALDFNGIIPLNDFAVRTASAIAKERNLPGWGDVAQENVCDKTAMKRSWQEAGLPTARHKSFLLSDVLGEMNIDWNVFPCIVKPSFSGGGSRGVFKASNIQEIISGLQKWQKDYKDGKLIVEEFIEGTEHTVEMVVQNGKTRILSISDKQNYPGNATIVQNLYLPGPRGHRYREAIEKVLNQAAVAMKLDNGAAHFEIMIGNDKVYLLEVGGRPGGGINWHPICELSTGYNYPLIYAAIMCGETPSYTEKNNEYLAWHYFNLNSGTLKAIEGLETLNDPDVVMYKIYEKIGEPCLRADNDLQRPGFVLVKGPSHQEALVKAQKLINGVRFICE